MTPQDAAHLLRASTFGFTAEQLRFAVDEGREKTLERLAARPAAYAAFEDEVALLTNREASEIDKQHLMRYRAMHSPWQRHEKETWFGSVAEERRVKTPVEFALNLSIAFGVQMAPAELHGKLVVLGQRFHDRGRPRRWLNGFTRVARAKLAAEILGKVQRFPDRRDLMALLAQRELPMRGEGRELALAIASSEEFQWI